MPFHSRLTDLVESLRDQNCSIWKNFPQRKKYNYVRGLERLYAMKIFYFKRDKNRRYNRPIKATSDWKTGNVDRPKAGLISIMTR